MADEINIHNVVVGSVFSNKFFEIERTFDDNIFNFNNKIFSVEKALHPNQFNFENYISRIEFTSYSHISIANISDKQYLMRARKVSDNSFVYWRSTNVDSTGQYSGFSTNELKDICIISYN